MRLSVIVLLPSLVSLPCEAQSLPPLAYLPLDHSAVPVLEHLVSRGAIEDPSPMVRPWTVEAVATALARADTSRLSRVERATVRGLARSFATPTSTAILGVEVDGGLRFSTHARRIEHSLRETGPNQHVPLISVTGALQFGPGLLVTHPSLDPNLDDDPDYGGRNLPIDARFPEAYASFRSRFVDLDFGGVSRNWGPRLFPGLLISPTPFSYDHLYLRLGPERVFLHMVIAQLDEMSDSDGMPNKRYWVAHRLSIRPWKTLDLAIWEGTMIAGPSRTLELWFLNPVKAAFQTEDEELVGSNVFLGGDFELRIPRGPTISGSMTIDDTQLFARAAPDEPTSYAVTVVASGPIGGGTISVGYTQVSHLMYRTPNPAESPMRLGTGLARNFSDYDQVTARGQWLVLPGVLVGPEVTLLRQGEGDFRQPFPAAADFPVTPTVFAGTVERTWRGAMHATVDLPQHFWAKLDLGVHRVFNDRHVMGAARTELVATLEARYRIGKLVPIQ